MALNPDLQSYLDLIPPPNITKPNFMSWLAANLSPYIDIQNCVNQIIDAFDLDEAEGNQLDILGVILGQSRTVDFEPTYDSPILQDDMYRLVLRAKIIQNQWGGTVQEVYNFWTEWFPSYPISIVDNQDMTMDVTLAGIDSPMLEDLVNNGYIVPKPAGVAFNYNLVGGPFFGYGYDTDVITGYGGNWYSG